MMSRSASRTRWMMFCFAAWAAMRPNLSAGSCARSSSPICASGSSFARASASVTWFSGSSTVSTTVFTSNSSTAPSSVLYCASIRFSWPNIFLAAESIASSSAFTMIWRSIPFSLLTCSMTRFRSGCIRPSSSDVRLGRARGPVEVVFDVRLLDLDERHDHRARVGIRDRHGVGGDGLERAVKLPAAGDRGPGANTHALADRPPEVRLADERSVESGRGALELVAPGHRVVRVEEVAQLTRDARQLVECDAPFRAVEQETQDGAPALRAVLHVDELEPRREGEGLRQLPDALGHRGPIHEPAPRNKKVGKRPTSVVSEAENGLIS